MTNRERENLTLSFEKPGSRGAVQETFYPWNLTIKRFKEEGLRQDIADGILFPVDKAPHQLHPAEKYLNVSWSEAFFEIEKYLGLDPVRRVSFTLPYKYPEEKILEDTPEYTIKQNITGKHTKYYKTDGHTEGHHSPVSCREDWELLKEFGNRQLDTFFTDSKIRDIYTPLKEGHDRGDYSVRINIEGFFWAPRTLFGIESHLYAFYDYPELMHDINCYILNVYLDKLVKVLEVLPADVVYIMEDLSGSNGPMLSPDLFDEFVGSYYKRLIPVLKQKGVKHVLVDTDGDFTRLIPNFISAGVDGFLPMDVNAGMDIVKVRRDFPRLKFIGGYNKLCIAAGKDSIDKEFERLLPVIRQGGYIPGCDHQVAPSTALSDYIYYIDKLKEIMEQSAADL